MRRLLATFALLAMFTGPLAAQEVRLHSALYAETLDRRNGETVRQIERIETVRSGMRLVTIVHWQNASTRGFDLTVPVPPRVAIAGASEAQYSHDGGRSWTATPGNRTGITHLRWRIADRDARHGTGRVSYSAIVR